VRPIVAELVGALGVTIASALLIAGGGFGGGPMTGGSMGMVVAEAAVMRAHARGY
jgi:hypothetical protein